MLGMVLLFCNPSTEEIQAGSSQGFIRQVQPCLMGVFLAIKRPCLNKLDSDQGCPLASSTHTCKNTYIRTH